MTVTGGSRAPKRIRELGKVFHERKVLLHGRSKMMVVRATLVGIRLRGLARQPLFRRFSFEIFPVPIAERLHVLHKRVSNAQIWCADVIDQAATESA